MIAQRLCSSCDGTVQRQAWARCRRTAGSRQHTLRLKLQSIRLHGNRTVIARLPMDASHPLRHVLVFLAFDGKQPIMQTDADTGSVQRQVVVNGQDDRAKAAIG